MVGRTSHILFLPYIRSTWRTVHRKEEYFYTPAQHGEKMRTYLHLGRIHIYILSFAKKKCGAEKTATTAEEITPVCINGPLQGKRWQM